MAKMTVDRLIERVIMKVQDTAFDEEFILEAINQCNVAIASDIIIKELATVSNVTVEANHDVVELPNGFHRNLSHCQNNGNANFRNIKVYRSRRLIDKNIFNSSVGSNILVVAPDGENLYVQYKPLADTELTLYYHRLPDELEEGGEFPSYIPEGYVYNLFFNYAVSQVYDYIEDSVDGDKANFLHHEDRFNKALFKLKMLIGEDPDEPFVPANYNRNFDFSE